ncbi:radical SAM protein [Streptacidiphilus sp. PB12-B1b]|uniref:radical SAM protein n=1 Tax=Streptacidiphilus sp. PB12-B1b TaxID=2705012 RepID=UPI0015FDD8F7|nr:radical SAM protein [Streptacidiphilus sp. PB12-B1b]QMU78062.1 radical SAM protein [Streptacidiphilus sp. PB12-B1b]
MHLAELIGLRPVRCAGLLVTLTRRCPLSCAHCSTGSTMAGEEPSAEQLLRFVGSFTPDDRPEAVLLTGGEPLLLPGLAARLAAAARRAGTRSVLLSGMFFARRERIPARIMRAITAVDHFSASLDAFHEREVPRADVFRAVRQVLDSGVAASFHLAGTGPDDPYLADATADIRRAFGGQVPMLVNEVRPVGRAAAWAAAARPQLDGSRALPCSMAAWPVVAFDGTVLACCNQQTVDRRPAPEHLTLGHIASDDWASVRRRALGSPTLRMIRTVGPLHLLARAGAERPAEGRPGGYCSTCRALGDRPEALAGAARDASGLVGELLDREAERRQAGAGPAELVRRHGSAAYADLVTLAQDRPAEAAHR